MPLERDDKLSIAGVAILAIGLLVLWYIFHKQDTPIQNPTKMSVSKDKEIDVLYMNKNPNLKRAGTTDGTGGFGKVPVRVPRPTRDQQPLTFNPDGEKPLIVINDPDKEILDGRGALSDPTAPPEDREIFTVKVDPSILDSLDEDTRAEYAGNEDLAKGELKATSDDFVWKWNEKKQKMELVSKGGMVEITNVTDDLYNSMDPSLQRTRRYVDPTMGSPVTSHERRVKEKVIYEKDGKVLSPDEVPEDAKD